MKISPSILYIIYLLDSIKTALVITLLSTIIIVGCVFIGVALEGKLKKYFPKKRIIIIFTIIFTLILGIIFIPSKETIYNMVTGVIDCSNEN